MPSNNTNNRNKELEQAIVRTMAFFDMFNYALTPLEIWKFLDRSCELAEVVAILKKKKNWADFTVEQWETKNGLYFLPGRQSLADRRTEQFDRQNYKFKIAQKAIKKLRYINGIKMVAICNNFFYKPDSDIDLFIITSRDRIWLTRFLTTIIIHLFGRRRYGQKVADRICLSFYISEFELDLRSVTLDYDPYFYYWLSFLIPVYDEGVHKKFWQANIWLKDKLPNIFNSGENHYRQIKDHSFSRFLKNINQVWFDTWLGDKLEVFLKKIQLKKMSKNYHSVAKENDSRVVISDTMLKFHEKDRRADYRDRFLKRVSGLRV